MEGRVRPAPVAIPPDEPPCLRKGRMDGRIKSGHDGMVAVVAVREQGEPGAARVEG